MVKSKKVWVLEVRTSYGRNYKYEFENKTKLNEYCSRNPQTPSRSYTSYQITKNVE